MPMLPYLSMLRTLVWTWLTFLLVEMMMFPFSSVISSSSPGLMPYFFTHLMGSDIVSVALPCLTTRLFMKSPNWVEN